MNVIYVAGAYRAVDWNGVWDNIMHARREARKLWKEGWAVICPHANSIFMDGDGLGNNRFLDGDLEIVRRCDAMYMLDNWHSSVGAIAEHNLAIDLKLEIHYEQK